MEDRGGTAASLKSAFGGKSDVAKAVQMAAFDSKQTSMGQRQTPIACHFPLAAASRNAKLTVIVGGS